ncbi:glycosyltransferase family 4 protein [bacterium]|nr:glycosyltransferase family 4 protein [bacterium]
MRILVLAHAFPYPPNDGHVGPIYHFLKHLATRIEMTMLTIRPEDEAAWRKGREIFTGWGMHVEAVAWRRLSKFARGLACLRDGRPWPNRFYSPELTRLTEAELARGGYDGVLSWGIMSAQHLPRRRLGIGHVLMGRDCLSLAHRRRHEAHPSIREWLQWKKIAAMERALFGRADRVFAVSPIDADAMRELAPNTDIGVLPTGVDAEAFRPAPEREEAGVVLFSGVMDFAPNEDAAIWAAREIWPIVMREEPEARLELAGRSPTPEVMALDDLPGVTVTGPVERMEDEIARAAVVISPLRQGTGIKNKVMEGAFMAKAMVVTPLSLDGLPLTAGRDCIVEADPRRFASAIVGLLNNPNERIRLGESAREAIEEGYSAEKLALRLAPVFEELRNKNKMQVTKDTK